MIHLFALAQRWSDDETVPVVVLFELLWGHHEDIHGLSDPIQARVASLSLWACAIDAFLHSGGNAQDLTAFCCEE